MAVLESGVHKTCNILSKMPKSIHPSAKTAIHEIWMAETKENADAAFDLFRQKYATKYPKAVACLDKDKERRVRGS